MKAIYNHTNNTVEIINISVAEASTISLALKNPLIAAAVGLQFIAEFNKIKDKACNVQENKKK
jgi:hypothetical protein